MNTYINAERSNKFKGAAIKKLETNKCKLMSHGVKCPDGQLHIIFRWYCKNKRKDPDNIAFAKKFILDGMVKSKCIPNDGFNNIKKLEDEFYIDSKNPRVEIEIMS